MDQANRKFRIWEAAALSALCAALLLGAWAQARQRGISEKLLRLHVIAVSDEAYEQEVKLRVRDAVLAYLEPQMEQVSSREEARALLSEQLEQIGQTAAEAAEGRQVTVSLSRENYPTRRYEGFTLPAGSYESLRIILGDGEGHNWWCVVYPPLCLSAAGAEQMRSVMAPADYEIVSEEGYTLRFRTVELWGELLSALDRW